MVNTYVLFWSLGQKGSILLLFIIWITCLIQVVIIWNFITIKFFRTYNNDSSHRPKKHKENKLRSCIKLNIINTTIREISLFLPNPIQKVYLIVQLLSYYFSYYTNNYNINVWYLNIDYNQWLY